jgi:hypothetical protein
MRMTTTNPQPVPLPAGAVKADDWDGDEQPHRIVRGAERDIDGRVVIRTSAAQWADGRIDTGPIGPPYVHVDTPGANGGVLTSAQARQLARLLITAADEIEQWVDALPYRSFPSGSNPVGGTVLNSQNISHHNVGRGFEGWSVFTSESPRLTLRSGESWSVVSRGLRADCFEGLRRTIPVRG